MDPVIVLELMCIIDFLYAGTVSCEIVLLLPLQALYVRYVETKIKFLVVTVAYRFRFLKIFGNKLSSRDTPFLGWPNIAIPPLDIVPKIHIGSEGECPVFSRCGMTNSLDPGS